MTSLTYEDLMASDVGRVLEKAVIEERARRETAEAAQTQRAENVAAWTEELNITSEAYVVLRQEVLRQLDGLDRLVHRLAELRLRCKELAGYLRKNGAPADAYPQSLHVDELRAATHKVQTLTMNVGRSL
jgi:hypothetical protein